MLCSGAQPCQASVRTMAPVMTFVFTKPDSEAAVAFGTTWSRTRPEPAPRTCIEASPPEARGRGGLKPIARSDPDRVNRNGTSRDGPLETRGPDGCETWFCASGHHEKRTMPLWHAEAHAISGGRPHAEARCDCSAHVHCL